MLRSVEALLNAIPLQKSGGFSLTAAVAAIAACSGNVENTDDDNPGDDVASGGSEGNSGGSTASGGSEVEGVGGDEQESSGGADGVGGSGSECVPQTCAELDACGETDNGCGEILQCEDCDEPCMAKTCEALGAECGEIDDGCGELLVCGSCDEGLCGETAANKCGCDADVAVDTGPRHARAARSAGFSGTDDQYSELYDQQCSDATDCIAPCVDRGGTGEFCAQHVCIDSTDDYCLPPTKWRGLSAALFEGTDIYDAAVTSLDTSNGAQHDRLIADDFKHEVPSNATIRGISVTIRHASDGASDQVVRVIKGGIMGEADRAKPELWPVDLEAAEYGGPEDLWGEEWTPEDVNAADFGVAVAALPASSGSRAYVDIIYTTVHYSLPCE